MPQPGTIPVRARHCRPVAFGLALLLVLLGAVSTLVLRATDGQLVYALDDAYIHMSIARHLAFDGVWGISADHFASASSSPLWTLLLAFVFRLTGVHDVVPFVLNILAAGALVVLVGQVLDAEGFTPVEAASTIAAAVLFAPVVPMVWIGMEHSTNTVFVVAAAYASVDLARPTTRVRPSTLLLFTLLACATRFESVFVATGCAALLLLAGRTWLAVATVGAAALPVVVNGAWNLAHGWFFLPASLLMKSTLPTGHTSWLGGFLDQLLQKETPVDFLVLAGAAILLLAVQLRRRHEIGSCGLLVIFLVASVLHLGLARFGYLYRYESYLMVLGVLAIATAVQAASADIARAVRIVGPTEVIAALAVAAVATGSARTVASNGVLVTTTGHIYRQHQQMARFVARYYDSSAVALNDIGAVSYRSHARVFDLGGLASIDVTRSRRNGTFDAAFINAWLDAGEVPIAIVFDAWFTGDRRFHDSWIRVARWITDTEEIPIEGAVTFYARTLRDARILARNISEFARTLPSGVTLEVDTQMTVPTSVASDTGDSTTAANSTATLQK